MTDAAPTTENEKIRAVTAAVKEAMRDMVNARVQVEIENAVRVAVDKLVGQTAGSLFRQHVIEHLQRAFVMTVHIEPRTEPVQFPRPVPACPHCAVGVLIVSRETGTLHCANQECGQVYGPIGEGYRG